ncbi:MAG TPA: helix-turn-helix transcriptional regulator [Caulobacteraceae bacterium]
MLSESDYGGFLDLLYGAAVEQGDWSPVIARFADLVGGHKAWKPDLDSTSGAGQGAVARIDPAAHETYIGHFAALNPFVRPNMAQAATPWPLAVMTDEDRFLKEDLVGTEYFNDFLAPLDMHSLLIIRLARRGSVLSTLNVTRPKRLSQFDGEDLVTARRLHPHLVRAFNLGAKFSDLQGFADGLADVLDRSVHGVLLLSDDGRVAHANLLAQRLLREPEGLAMVGQRLTVTRADEARRLEALIGHAAGPMRAGGSMSVATPSRTLPLSLTVAPLRSRRISAVRAPSVLVCVTDLEAGVSLPEQRLRDLFGLTAAETRLALAMFEGLAPREAAERFGVSPHTVHAQLGRIFEKTGAKRQADLVRLMMRAAGVSLGTD